MNSEQPEAESIPEIKTLIHGVFEPSRVLELIEFFIDWAERPSGLRKRFCLYNQYWGVKAAIASVKRLRRRRRPPCWHRLPRPGVG